MNLQKDYLVSCLLADDLFDALGYHLGCHLGYTLGYHCLEPHLGYTFGIHVGMPHWDTHLGYTFGINIWDTHRTALAGMGDGATSRNALPAPCRSSARMPLTKLVWLMWLFLSLILLRSPSVGFHQIKGSVLTRLPLSSC